jgi:hypothetical protein
VDSACGRGLSQVGLPGRGAGGRCGRCRSRRGVEAKPTAGRVSHIHLGRRLRCRPLRVDQRESVSETYSNGLEHVLAEFPTCACATRQSSTTASRKSLSVGRLLAGADHILRHNRECDLREGHGKLYCCPLEAVVHSVLFRTLSHMNSVSRRQLQPRTTIWFAHPTKSNPVAFRRR